MGDVIDLSARRRARFQRRRQTEHVAPPERRVAEFAFDLASPFTYLLAERVDRAFEQVTWTPIPAAALPGGERGLEDGLLRAAEERARAVRLPLVWPEPVRSDLPTTMRVAAHAAARGRGGAFAMAAARLAFGGGFDLEEPEYLEAAVAAAGLDPDTALAAAQDPAWDLEGRAAATRLAISHGARLPLLRTNARDHAGEAEIADALTAVQYARVAAAHAFAP